MEERATVVTSFLPFSISFTIKSCINLCPQCPLNAGSSTSYGRFCLWKVFTLQRFSVSETDSWQVLKNILYYLWFSKPPKRHLPKAWINQLPNRDEHSNYQIGDNKLYKISSIWQTGEQLLKYLLRGNVHFDSKLFIIFLIPRFWTQGIFFWNDEVWED